MKSTILTTVLAMTLATASAQAATILFSGTGTDAANPGVTLSASVEFKQVGTSLIVTLKNTGNTTSKLVPSSILEGVVFDVAGAPTLTPVSAMMGANDLSTVSQMVGGSNSCGGSNVGCWWAYKHNSSGIVYGGDYGVSATGYGGAFGTYDEFKYTQGQPDGMGYGLLPASYGGLNGGASGNKFIQDSVVFTFTLPATYTLAANAISNVSFFYGTSSGEPHFAGTQSGNVSPTPEPESFAMLGVGLVALGVWKRGRRAQARQ